jgi:hypothetical protein
MANGSMAGSGWNMMEHQRKGLDSAAYRHDQQMRPRRQAVARVIESSNSRSTEPGEISRKSALAAWSGLGAQWRGAGGRFLLSRPAFV